MTCNMVQFGMGAASAGFDPTKVPGLELMLTPKKGLTLSSGTTTWADQSGASDSTRNATQSGDTGFSLNAADADYEGEPTLSMSASELVTSAWTTPLDQPYTIFIVGNDDGGSAVEYYMADPAYYELYWEGSGAGLYASYGTSHMTAAPTSPGIPCVFEIGVNGDESYFAISQATPQTTGGNEAGYDLGQYAITIGSQGPGAHELQGKIAMILVYSNLSSENSAIVRDGLGKLFGITIGP